MQPSVDTRSSAPRCARTGTASRARHAQGTSPGIYPRPSFGLPSAFSARLRTSSRAIAVTEHLPILSISSGRVPPSRVLPSIASALSRAEWGRKRPVTDIHDCLVVFGSISGRSTSSGARTARGHRGADAPSSARFLRPREYLFNNRESDRRLPHLRIDQVRGVRLGNPTGSDPR